MISFSTGKLRKKTVRTYEKFVFFFNCSNLQKLWTNFVKLAKLMNSLLIGYDILLLEKINWMNMKNNLETQNVERLNYIYLYLVFISSYSHITYIYMMLWCLGTIAVLRQYIFWLFLTHWLKIRDGT